MNYSCDLGPIFIAGYPSDIGGADTECWHTVKLWRKFGLDVRLIPTWRAVDKWRERLDSIGCKTYRCSPSQLRTVPGLRGAVVVSFCNAAFLRKAADFRKLNCRIVWVNCMTWMSPYETAHMTNYGPFDRYVFQSHYQRDELFPNLANHGIRPEQCQLIRGALDWREFPFRPRRKGIDEPFIVGRISRADADKFAADTWSIYENIPGPLRARILGWNDAVQAKLGPPPPWAECLQVGAEPAQRFLRSLHCVLQANGGAAENWPRSGLEAMASGVPVVAEDAWGWREMIEHGVTGFLGRNGDELTHWAATLVRDDSLRLKIAHQAYRRLVDELANPHAIFCRWKELFESLRCREPVSTGS